MSQARALSFHVLRSPGEQNDDGEFPMPAIDGVRWLAGTETEWLADGSVRADLSHRLWLGFWDDAAQAANAVQDAPSWLPDAGTGAAHWSVALQPYLSRGDVNWRAGAEPGPVCEATGTRPRRDQAIVTITSFGVSAGRESFLTFGQRVRAARRSLRATTGMQAEFEIYAIVPAFVDGSTITLWRCEADAMAWAYKQPPHRPSMEWAQEGRIFERSSFTRATLLAQSGSWPAAQDTPIG